MGPTFRRVYSSNRYHALKLFSLKDAFWKDELFNGGNPTFAKTRGASKARTARTISPRFTAMLFFQNPLFPTADKNSDTYETPRNTVPTGIEIPANDSSVSR